MSSYFPHLHAVPNRTTGSERRRGRQKASRVESESCASPVAPRRRGGARALVERERGKEQRAESGAGRRAEEASGRASRRETREERKSEGDEEKGVSTHPWSLSRPSARPWKASDTCTPAVRGSTYAATTGTFTLHSRRPSILHRPGLINGNHRARGSFNKPRVIGRTPPSPPISLPSDRRTASRRFPRENHVYGDNHATRYRSPDTRMTKRPVSGTDAPSSKLPLSARQIKDSRDAWIMATLVSEGNEWGSGEDYFRVFSDSGIENVIRVSFTP